LLGATSPAYEGCSRFRQGLDPKAVAFQNRFFQHLQLNLGMGKLSLSIRSHSPAGPHSILRKGSLITRNPPLPRMDYLSDTGIDQVLTPSSAEVRLALVRLSARLARTCIIPHPQQTCLCTAMVPRCAGVDMLKPASAAVARPQGGSSRKRGREEDRKKCGSRGAVGPKPIICLGRCHRRSALEPRGPIGQSRWWS
jgi:hypothetical protein